MYRIFAMGAVVAGAASLGACATVTRTPTTAWQVNSVPAGASVRTSNGYGCEATPCSFVMPRRSTFIATLSHPGYKTASVGVTNHVSLAGGAAFLGNALIGGVIGATIDIATGSTQDLTPDGPLITLEHTAFTPDAAAFWSASASTSVDAPGSAGAPMAPGDTVTIQRF